MIDTVQRLAAIMAAERAQDPDQVMLTTHEIRRANNWPDRLRLALVLVAQKLRAAVVYVRDFDHGQPGFAQTTASYHLNTPLYDGGPPA
jgi:hypothetical protein